MIGTINVKQSASKQNIPLMPIFNYVDTPINVRIIDVPKKIGTWKITDVFFNVKYPDNSIISKACVLTAGAWVATVEGTSTSGTIDQGYWIAANGIDEDGTPVTNYILGVGQLFVTPIDGKISLGNKSFYLHLLESEPENPTVGDVVSTESGWRYYNGEEWLPFGSGIDFTSEIEELSEKIDTAVEEHKEFVKKVFTPKTVQKMNEYGYPVDEDGYEEHEVDEDGTVKLDNVIVSNKSNQVIHGNLEVENGIYVRDDADTYFEAFPAAGVSVKNLHTGETVMINPSFVGGEEKPHFVVFEKYQEGHAQPMYQHFLPKESGTLAVDNGDIVRRTALRYEGKPVEFYDAAEGDLDALVEENLKFTVYYSNNFNTINQIGAEALPDFYTAYSADSNTSYVSLTFKVKKNTTITDVVKFTIKDQTLDVDVLNETIWNSWFSKGVVELRSAAGEEQEAEYEDFNDTIENIVDDKIDGKTCTIIREWQPEYDEDGDSDRVFSSAVVFDNIRAVMNQAGTTQGNLEQFMEEVAKQFEELS